MGVTLSKVRSRKAAKRKQKGCRKADLYYHNEEVSGESFNSQTFAKVPYGDQSSKEGEENTKIKLKNEKRQEPESIILEKQLKNGKLETIKLLEENEQLRVSLRRMAIDSALVKNQSARVSDASTSTDHQGPGENLARTADAATNTDKDTLQEADINNLEPYFNGENILVGRNNTVNIFERIPSDESTVKDARILKLEKNNKSLLKKLQSVRQELKSEKKRVQTLQDANDILRRQNDDFEARQTKMLETSLPFKASDFRFLRYL